MPSRTMLALTVAATVIAPAVAGSTELQTAESLMRNEQFGSAAEMYQSLVSKNPSSVDLRLQWADALAKDRRWDEATAQYRTILKQSPNHAQALRNLAQVQRWNNRLPEARSTYAQAIAAAPNDPDPVLGLAATHALDFDNRAAGALYARAAEKWPNDPAVAEAIDRFKKNTGPRVYLYYEDDLSFTTTQLGTGIPFAGREEIGAERQIERSKDYRTGAEVYVRQDNKLSYTHFFGMDHALEFNARASSYEYNVPVTSFSAIDTYQEYRVRYTFPVVADHAIAIRAGVRPTVLLLNQQEFNATKLEAEVRSRWTPRARTVVGVGWLRDLSPTATTTTDLNSNSLLRLEAQYDLTHRFDVSGKYITNPDLDDSIDSTRILQASYSMASAVSGIARWRHDNYKTGDDQTAMYLGVRYVPTTSLWTELGLKSVSRGTFSSFDPLLSMVYRF